MTAPAFILSSKSLVEYSSYWTEHPSTFVAPSKEKDPQKRAMLVLLWFLSTLKQQYSSRSEQLGTEKKPLNPFLGELFLGYWKDDAGETNLISEQVSHHPPVTAYAISNEKHGVRLEGYNGQRASFATTIYVKQIGYAILHLDEFNEDYLITLPSLHIEGLITGAPYVELEKSSYIQSSSGYTSKIEYSGKGWVSGKKNSFTATLHKTGKESEVLYKASGQWSDSFSIKDASKNVVKTWEHKQNKVTPLIVAPIEEQDELESRRAWQKVASAIANGDLDTTAREKSIIENQQRELRKKEREEGREWERRYFSRAEKAPVSVALAKKVGETIDSEKTNGIWAFDEKKATAAKPPYRQQ